MQFSLHSWSIPINISLCPGVYSYTSGSSSIRRSPTAHFTIANVLSKILSIYSRKYLSYISYMYIYNLNNNRRSPLFQPFPSLTHPQHPRQLYNSRISNLRDDDDGGVHALHNSCRIQEVRDQWNFPSMYLFSRVSIWILETGPLISSVTTEPIIPCTGYKNKLDSTIFNIFVRLGFCSTKLISTYFSFNYISELSVWLSTYEGNQSNLQFPPKFLTKNHILPYLVYETTATIGENLDTNSPIDANDKQHLGCGKILYGPNPINHLFHPHVLSFCLLFYYHFPFSFNSIRNRSPWSDIDKDISVIPKSPVHK